MAQKLTDSSIKALPAPSKGNKIYYDDEVKGFGCRVTATGARAFILNYRTRTGRERRFTIGSLPEWKAGAAREEAKRLKREIDGGQDPLEAIKQEREAPTMARLCERYIAEHLPKKKWQADDRAMIANEILPALKHRKVADITFEDIDALHRKVTGRGRAIRANRLMALLSKMFSLAVKWKWCDRNPVRGIERNPEHKRHRYLTPEETVRLTTALAEHPSRDFANIVRLLLLTGARRGEVLSMRWTDVDLAAGVWTKPASATKQKALHRVPLSAPARQLLNEIRQAVPSDAVFVFPAHTDVGHRTATAKDWEMICDAAGLADLRLHDLRHSYASMLASAGMSLPIIGALLGHTQPATTARYAHLLDDPLRQATERVGAIVANAGKQGAEVVPLKGGQ